MQKRILIPWSGGVDSTVLVLHAVRDGHLVYYAHLKCDQPKNAYQVEAERLPALRQAIVEKVQARKAKREEPGIVQEPIRRYSEAELNFSSTKMPYKQMPAWFIHLMTMIGKDDYDEVQLGYLLNDDAARATTDLAKAWHYLAKAIYGFDFKVPALTFPVLHHRKHELIAELKHWEIMDLVWWCELPQIYNEGPLPCEYCPSCVRHRRAIEDKRLNEQFAAKFVDLAVNYDRTTPENPIEETAKETEV